MAMYNWVFGDEPPLERGRLLLAILGYTAFNDVGRYRDAWVETSDSGPVIAVYTRNGGGNREGCWHRDDVPQSETADSAQCDCASCRTNYAIPAHECWIRGQDDTFDSTYRTEYYRVPEEYREALTEVAQEPVDTSQRWLDAIEQMKASLATPEGQEVKSD